MAHRIFNLYEVADYLHLSRGDIERLVRRNEIPFERKGEKLIFNRNSIDEWASKRIIGSGKGSEQLAEFHKKTSTAKNHNLAKEHAIIPDLLKPAFVEQALKSLDLRPKPADLRLLADWPRPEVAAYPWDQDDLAWS